MALNAEVTAYNMHVHTYNVDEPVVQDRTFEVVQATRRQINMLSVRDKTWIPMSQTQTRLNHHPTSPATPSNGVDDDSCLWKQTNPDDDVSQVTA